jgi:phosphohistidine phosphatase SixA
LRRLLLPVLAALAVAGGCGGDDADERPPRAEPRAEAVPARLVERLRDGGYVLAFRHAATDSGLDTTGDLSDCSRQRNLNAEGRRQSRDIGRAFERLGIPAGRVLASPFCRTRDTARLAFGRVRASRSLLSVEFFESVREGRRKGLRRLLSDRPRRGTNTVLVTHESAILDATGADPEEGDAVVAAPGGRPPGYTVVAEIPVAAWRGAASGR